jgi:uncharacterized protein DUF4190
MSYPVPPPPSEDPTAGLGSNRDGYTRSFDPPPPVDPYAPPVQAYQPPPAYQPPVHPPAPVHPAYYPPMAVPVARPTSTWSVAAMALGIAGVFIGWCTLGLPFVLAIIFGHIGLNETGRGARSGKGMAVAGLILGYVGTVVTVLIAVWAIGSGAAST